MNKLKEVLIQLIPFIIAFLIPIFFDSEIGFTIVVLLLIAVSLKISYEKNELRLIALGIVIGLFIEVISGFLYRMQYWENDSLFGVPTWLPCFGDMDF